MPITDNTAGLSVGTSVSRWNALYSANGVLTTSDRSQKKNIQTLNYGLKEILKLKPVSYNWKKEFCNSLTIPDEEKDLKIGFLAQEVLKVIPEMVYTQSYQHTSDDETAPLELVNNKILGINYEELIPVLVKAKQEQDDRILELQNEVNKLSQQIHSLIKK